MPRIKIEDLPVLEDLSAKEKKGIFGGTTLTRTYDLSSSEEETTSKDTTFEASFEGSYELDVLDAADLASPSLPGGSVLSAAISRTGQLKDSSGSS